MSDSRKISASYRIQLQMGHGPAVAQTWRLLSLRLTVALVIQACCSSCAVTYEDRDGATHVLGLASVVIPSPDSKGARAARVLRVRTIGIRASHFDGSVDLSIGYSDEALTRIGNNSCVAVPQSALSN